VECHESQGRVKDRHNSSEKKPWFLLSLRISFNILRLAKEKFKSYEDNETGALFFEVSKKWISCAVPAEAQLDIKLCMDFSTITDEHPLHVVMAHYC